MQEGINLSVVLSGATLVGIIGIFVRVWIAGRAQQIEPTICERQIKSNSADHENIFSRLSHNEQRLSSLEANVMQIDRKLEKMDTKLDTILNMQRSSQ